MPNNTTPIDHETAVSERLVDKYLLKELSTGEAEEFERHYFECAACAEAVESGEALIANACEVLREMPVVERAGKPERSFFGLRWTWTGIPIPATAFALALVAIYQGAVVIPRLNQPRVLPAFQILGASRGQEDAKVVPAGATAFALSADVPPDVQAASYVCELRAAGRTVFTLKATPPAPGQPITILVPAKGLKSGTYQFAILGGAEKIFDTSFELRFE